MWRVLAALLLLTCVCVGQTAKAPAPKPEQVLVQADRDFQRATASKRLEGWMQYMAPDAVLISGKPAVGTDAIREVFAPAFAKPDYQLTWEPKHAEMFASGIMGYTSGRYEQHHSGPDGKMVVVHGNYITVWKKQSDGSWKVIADGGTPDSGK